MRDSRELKLKRNLSGSFWDAKIIAYFATATLALIPNRPTFIADDDRHADKIQSVSGEPYFHLLHHPFASPAHEIASTRFVDSIPRSSVNEPIV